MSIAESILPEFDHETATTRTLLERVPQDKAEWKPHAKSMSLGELAMHVATLPKLGAHHAERRRSSTPTRRTARAYAPPAFESVGENAGRPMTRT